MDPYEHTIDLLLDAIEKDAKTGNKGKLSSADLVRALADLTAAFTLEAGGEEGMRLIIERFEARIEDWKLGLFPAPEIRGRLQ